MKKILAVLFLVSVFCPAAFAQYQNKESKEVRKGLQEVINSEVKTKPQDKKPNQNAKITGNSDKSEWYNKKVVSKEYVTEEQGYFNGVDYEEGRKMTSDSYEIITVKIPANEIMEQIKIDYFSDEPAIYFDEEHNAIVIADSKDKTDKIFIKLDYNFSLRPADASKWKATNPDTRKISTERLMLTIKYAPKYFTLTTEEKEANVLQQKVNSVTYPVLSFEGKNIYLVPTEEFIKDFGSK